MANDEPSKPTSILTTDFEDFTPNEKLAFEKEFLGLYLTAHPQMDNLMRVKSSESTHEIELLEEEKEQTAGNCRRNYRNDQKDFYQKNRQRNGLYHH